MDVRGTSRDVQAAATKLIQLNNLDVPSNTVSNFVFDENGKEVYKNIPSGKIFESINQLITR